MPHAAALAGGLARVDTVRPCSTRQWQKSEDFSGGRSLRSAISIFTGSFTSSTSPIRFESRMQWVSTTVEPGTRYTSPRIRFAVLRPTPGSAVSSSIVSGTLPPCFSSSICAQATMSRALARKKPQA